MISPLLVASTGARTTLLALADTRRSWAPPTPTPRIPDQVVGVAPRSAPLQAAGAFDALLVCAPLVYSINKSLYESQIEIIEHFSQVSELCMTTHSR